MEKLKLKVTRQVEVSYTAGAARGIIRSTPSCRIPKMRAAAAAEAS